MATDVAAIRSSVERFTAGGSWAGPAASAPVDRAIVVPGESRFRLDGWIAGIVLCLVPIGAGVWLVLAKGSGTQKAIGASLVTIGTLTGGGFALVKDVKIDSVFKVDVEKLLDHLRIQIGQLGGAGPERLGSVDKFKLGDDKLIEAPPRSYTPVEKVGAIRDMAAAWLAGRADGKNAVLLVIGGADRLPIEGKKGQQQYDDNVGLARARGEAVKRALLDSCRKQAEQRPQKCDLSEDQIIVLVSGPRHTPEAGDTSARASKEGFPEDRRVDVWALWTRKGAGFSIGR